MNARHRYARTTDTQQAARALQHIFHLPDGPEQQARDNDMRRAMALELASYTPSPEATSVLLPSIDDGGVTQTAGNPNHWADRGKSERQFSYDADAQVEQWWTAVGSKLPIFQEVSSVL